MIPFKTPVTERLFNPDPNAGFNPGPCLFYKIGRLTGLLILLVFSNLPSGGLSAQNTADASADTLKPVKETIALADISVRSAEAVSKTKERMESLVRDEEIFLLEVTTDSLAFVIDSLLKADRGIDLSSKNNRFLRNKEIYWKEIESRIKLRKVKITEIVYQLDQQKYALDREVSVWRNTKKAFPDLDSASGVLNRIDGLVSKLDSARYAIQGKSERMLDILDQTTTKDLAVNNHIELIRKTIREKENQVFVPNQPPLWKTDFSKAENWDIFQPLFQFSIMEINELTRYFRKNIPGIVVQGILLVLLIAAFRTFRSRIRKTAINQNSIYQRMLHKVLSSPVSAALILGLFSAFLVFQNRPMIFEEASRLIVMVPLIYLINRLGSKKHIRNAYALGFMMLLQMGSFIFPPGNLFYLFSLLSVAIIQIWVLSRLLRHFRKFPLQHKPLNRIIMTILLVHLGFSIAGLAGIIAGMHMLSEMALNVTIMDAFTGFLLMISAMILNGLAEVGIESKVLQKLNVIRLYGKRITPIVTRIINLVAVIIWLATALHTMNIYLPVWGGIRDFFTRVISIGSASFTLWGIVIFFLVIWLSILISKIIRAILEEDILDKFNLSKGVPHTISVLIGYALVTLGLILAVRAAGMPTDKLTILFGAFGVGIGFGLQNIFNNLVSGLILLFERPIQIGDTIEVGKLTGNVKSIGIRSSHIHTFEGAEVIVPNGNLISNEVVNWTLSDQKRRIEVLAGVAYGSDPHKVKELFDKILNDHPDILQDPPPSVFFQNLGESSLDFRLLFWTNNFGEWVRIRSDIVFAVHDILKQEGIEIPYPQRDLHLRSVDQRIEIIKREGND